MIEVWRLRGDEALIGWPKERAAHLACGREIRQVSDGSWVICDHDPGDGAARTVLRGRPNGAIFRSIAYGSEQWHGFEFVADGSQAVFKAKAIMDEIQEHIAARVAERMKLE